MTDLRKAAEMALEALEDNSITYFVKYVTKLSNARESLRQALAQPDWTTDTPVPPFKYFDSPEYKIAQPEQERLSLRLDVGGGIARAAAACGDQIESVAQELPKREWVELTDEERVKCYETTGHYQTLRPQDSFAVLSLARAIEAKLKEKNT